jgi:hypothetical protein
MCSDLMREAGQSGMNMPRQTFDVTRDDSSDESDHLFDGADVVSPLGDRIRIHGCLPFAITLSELGCRGELSSGADSASTGRWQ